MDAMAALLERVLALEARLGCLERAEVIPTSLMAPDGDPNPAWSVGDDGEWLKTGVMVPKVLAYNSNLDADQTGHGATPTVDFDTEVFDTGADFASDTFTAPVTGRYLLIAAVRVTDLTSAMTYGQLRLVTSNRTYYCATDNVYARSTSGAASLLAVTIADMDAGDTATVQVLITNGVGDTANIYGQTVPVTYFCVALLP